MPKNNAIQGFLWGILIDALLGSVFYVVVVPDLINTLKATQGSLIYFLAYAFAILVLLCILFISISLHSDNGRRRRKFN